MNTQNPSIFRSRTIFRTLVYWKPKAFSEHCQTSAIERLAKNSCLAHFSASTPKNVSLKNFLYFFVKITSSENILKRKLFFYFRKWNTALSSLSPQKFYLKKLLTFFPKKTCSEKVSYLFSKKALIFWKRKSRKNPYISGNRTSLYFGNDIFSSMVYLEP